MRMGLFRYHNCTAYSPQCIKVLPLNSKRGTITCHHCKSMRHQDSDEPELPMESPPSPPPPPSLPPPSSAINSNLNTPTNSWSESHHASVGVYAGKK